MKRLALTALFLACLTLSACGPGKSTPTSTPTIPSNPTQTSMPTATFTLPPLKQPTETETPTLAETPTVTLDTTVTVEATETITLDTTVTVGPTETITPTSNPLPIISTTRGDYTVNGAQFAERFPLDCTALSCSLIAPTNFKVVVITLERVTPDFTAGNFMLDRLYVEAADGSQGILLAQSISADKAQEFLAFELPSTARYIKLYWPGNQPISLVLAN